MKKRALAFAKRILSLICAILALLAPDNALSAPQFPNPELSWMNKTVDGKKTTVFCIFRDSRGLMWLGANGGLYFYDGVAMHGMGENVLSGTQIYSIVESDDKLYVGCNNGLFVYDYATGNASALDIDTPREIRVLMLVDDDLWIGGLNGISKYNIRNNTIADCSAGLPHKSVYSLLRDSRGIIYVGTFNGLARWNSHEGNFSAVPVRTNDKNAPSALFANCLMESHDGESIYVGGEGFLYKYSPSGDKWERITSIGDTNVKSICRGSDGHLLIGTNDGVFDMSDDVVKHYRHDSRQELSLADNEIWCIFADQQNNVWAGHERGFSIAFNSDMLRTIKLSALVNSGEGNEIYSIFRDSDNELWLGGTNGVIRLANTSAPKWYRHTGQRDGLSHNRIRAITEDAEHHIWFATDGGLNRLTKSTADFDVFYVTDKDGQHKSNWVYALIEDDDRLWVGSFLGGLHRLDKGLFNRPGGVIVSDLALNADTPNAHGSTIPNNLINNVHKDANGNLWVLLFRDSTLTCIDREGNLVNSFNILDLTGSYPTQVNIDKRGRAWCAYWGGVIVFDSDGSQHVVKLPYTNSDEAVLTMSPVDEGMWLSTQSNVWRIDGTTLAPNVLPIPQRSYTAIYEDPLSNKVYLGGVDEILEVDKSITDNASEFRAINMVLDNSDEGKLNLYDIKGGINGKRLPYGGNVTMLVSSLDYSPEALQRYMYRLSTSPSDNSDMWIVLPEGSNAISFFDLKMGNYTLYVNSIGSPATPIAIPLSVEAPVFLSWRAFVIYAMILAIIIYVVVLYSRRRHNRALQAKEREAALANVEKKLSFLSDVSHDLKTPLSMIIGPVSVMRGRVKDEDIKRNLDTVYENAVRLNNMIHRTIEINHLEDSDEDMLILSLFDVVEFCRGIFEIFKENNPNKNFVFHAEPDQILIEADAVKFESVITNLLSNACKYSQEKATISCGISFNNDTVEIVVSDDGLGISDADKPLVFQRMFRAPATSKLREGTGLGLYLIKKYLELMKGNISLYSKEGQGTSFIVTLPISDKAKPSNRNNAAPLDAGKPKILVIEDNIQISDFIVELLRDEYTCMTAENGRSGLAIAQSIIPDLIIVDEMMPIMTGLEMVKLMKQHPRLSLIPVIMLTAKSDNKTESESIKLGIDIFMTKPFEPATLLGRIKHLLKARTDLKEKMRVQAITEAESKPIQAESVSEKQLAKIAKIIEDYISDPDLNVNFLCEKSGMTSKQLYRLIKKYMDVAPLDYIRKVRLQKAAMLLSQHRFTVSEICYMVGFKTPSYFTKCFQNQYGVKPSQYQSDDEAR